MSLSELPDAAGAWGTGETRKTSYGTVTNDSSQEIYLDDSRMIKEVYVEKGDEVQKGDPLLAYDTAELQIEWQNDISTIESSRINTKKLRRRGKSWLCRC